MQDEVCRTSVGSDGNERRRPACSVPTVACIGAIGGMAELRLPWLPAYPTPTGQPLAPPRPPSPGKRPVARSGSPRESLVAVPLFRQAAEAPLLVPLPPPPPPRRPTKATFAPPFATSAIRLWERNDSGFGSIRSAAEARASSPSIGSNGSSLESLVSLESLESLVEAGECGLLGRRGVGGKHASGGVSGASCCASEPGEPGEAASDTEQRAHWVCPVSVTSDQSELPSESYSLPAACGSASDRDGRSSTAPDVPDAVEIWGTAVPAGQL